MLAMTDWSPVVLAIAAAIPGVVAAVIAWLNRRDLRTPSGPKIGVQVERAHELSAIALAHAQRAQKRSETTPTTAEEEAVVRGEGIKPNGPLVGHEPEA